MNVELPEEKPSLEEAYQNTLDQFSLGDDFIEGLTERLQILQKKKLKRGKDKELGIILEGMLLLMKATTDSLGTNWRITYLLRDLSYDFNSSMKNLTESVESLAKESPDKKLGNRILEQVEKHKINLESKIQDARKEVEDIHNNYEDLFKKLSKDKEK